MKTILQNRWCIILCLLLCYTVALCQSTNKDHGNFATAKYAGIYKDGKPGETSFGIITIYPETDTSILFYLHAERSPPGSNEGHLYGHVTISVGKGKYLFHFSDSDICKCTFRFEGNHLNIRDKWPEDQQGCGFGYGVDMNGIYTRTSSIVPDRFTEDKEAIFFKTTPPEIYYQYLNR